MELPSIQTKDFLLRPYRWGDEHSLRRHINSRKIYENTAHIPYPYRLKDARDWIRNNMAERRKRQPAFIAFAIDVRGQVVGGIGFHNIEGHKAEIGYWLAERYWGKGIMTRALQEITELGFSYFYFQRLYARVFSHNIASGRVLEKAGYSREGLLKADVQKDGRLIDCYVFGKVVDGRPRLAAPLAPAVQPLQRRLPA